MKKEIDNGGPAFPTSHSPDYANEIVGGMTLRDYFAAKVLPEIYQKMSFFPGDAARKAYDFADAMLKERNK